MPIESKNPLFKQTLLLKMEANHFMQHLGFIINSIEAGAVEGYLNLEKIHLQQNGFVHGGVISTLADIVMGFSAYSLVEQGWGTVTSDLKIAYLRPGLGDRIIARGEVIKAGKLLYFCEADILCKNKDEKEILIARGYSTMAAVKYPGS